MPLYPNKFGSSMALEQMPKPGDLIEIFRPGYRHWAVYISDNEVIHVGKTSEVKCERLRDVVGEDKWKVNNLLDDEYQVKEIAVIIKEARQQVGNRVPYSLSSSNCEHFVTELRYGKGESRQVRNAVVVTGVATAATFGAAVLAGALLSGSSKEEKNTN